MQLRYQEKVEITKEDVWSGARFRRPFGIEDDPKGYTKAPRRSRYLNRIARLPLLGSREVRPPEGTRREHRSLCGCNRLSL